MNTSFSNNNCTAIQAQRSLRKIKGCGGGLSLFSLLGLIIAIYTIFQAWKLISGPIIEVFTPQNGAVYNSTLIQIEGRAQNISYLNLNDRMIFTDKDGKFSEKLLLSPGLNIIKIDGKDRFRTHREKIIQVILKEY